MPALSLVLPAALFGLGAALLVVGVADVNLVALGLGVVLVVVAVRLRSRLQQDGGVDAGDGAGGEEASAPTAASSRAAGAARDHRPDDGGTAPAGDDQGAVDAKFVVETADATTDVGEDGETLHGSGYQLRDAASAEPVDSRALTLARDGAQVIALDIAADPADELQADELAPGQPVVLVPHRSPDGRVDGIRVFDEVVDHLAGWLPDEAAKELAGELRRGPMPARALYEWRDSAGRRRGLTVLVHRADAVVDG